MEIVVAGASGLVGAALVPALRESGHTVTQLVRHTPGPGEAYWSPSEGQIAASVFEGVDAVICLSGENIADGRWTDEKKKRILESRKKSAGLISKTIAASTQRPATFICASAVGYYGGDEGDTLHTESSPAGNDFLASVCVDWERATRHAKEKGVRVVNLRFGAILDPKGGMLAKLLTPFKLGLGGVVGSGDQYLSWLTLDEAVRVIQFALGHQSLAGPVNAVTPNPVTNREFTKTLGGVLHRPTVFPVPAAVLRRLFGEMGDVLVLGSTRVAPGALQAAGYSFAHPQLEDALRAVLK